MKHLKIRCIVCIAILMMLSGGQSVWGDSSDIDSDTDSDIAAAVEQYREGYFQEAKEPLEKIAARSDEKESVKTALAYMALIEPAFGDEIVRKRFEWK